MATEMRRGRALRLSTTTVTPDEDPPEGSLLPAEGLPQLTPQMQRHVDRTLAADRKGGEALWEKACAVADARADAKHGEWGRYLEATGQNERAAQRLTSIAERGRHDGRFRDAIISGFLSFSVAHLTAQADDALLDQLLAAPVAPTKREVEALITSPGTPLIEAAPLADDAPLTAEELDDLSALGGWCNAITKASKDGGQFVRVEFTQTREGDWYPETRTIEAWRYEAQQLRVAADARARRARGIAVEVSEAAIPDDWDLWRQRALALPKGELTLNAACGAQLRVNGVSGFTAYLLASEGGWERITKAIQRHEARYAPPAAGPLTPEEAVARGIYLHTPRESIPADWDAWQARARAVGAELTLGVNGMVTGTHAERRLGTYRVSNQWPAMKAEVEVIERADPVPTPEPAPLLALPLLAPTPPEFGDYVARAAAVDCVLVRAPSGHYALREPDGETSWYVYWSQALLRIRAFELGEARTGPASFDLDGNPLTTAAVIVGGDTPLVVVEDEEGEPLVSVAARGLEEIVAQSIAEAANALRLLSLGEAHQVDTPLLDDLRRAVLGAQAPARLVVAEVLALAVAATDQATTGR